MPETLFEAEMFGYVKGAFTGASANRTGLVEAAEGGTLFLDEIGEIPLSDQVKLLRLLETRRFRRVGSSEWQRADFRLVCATNRDLAAMVETGEFRQDLYFRLNVFDIRLPPLRERIDDVELLIASILRRLGKREYRCSAAALACLRSYRFPGNIRELRNIIERATLLAEDKLIDVPQLPAQCRQRKVSAAEGLPTQIVPLAEAEQRYLLHALAIHRGDRKSLAQALGISERALYRKLAAARPAAAPAAGDGITDR
jgi:transcriptional regulator with PAS, ATPase and Fis domain